MGGPFLVSVVNHVGSSVTTFLVVSGAWVGVSVRVHDLDVVCKSDTLSRLGDE